MPDSVYKVIELIGSSNESWEKAAANAVEQAAKSLRDLRVAEVVKLDIQLDAKGKVEAYRAKLSVSFKFEASEPPAQVPGRKSNSTGSATSLIEPLKGRRRAFATRIISSHPRSGQSDKPVDLAEGFTLAVRSMQRTRHVEKSRRSRSPLIGAVAVRPEHPGPDNKLGARPRLRDSGRNEAGAVPGPDQRETWPGRKQADARVLVPDTWAVLRDNCPLSWFLSLDGRRLDTEAAPPAGYPEPPAHTAPVSPPDCAAVGP